MTVYLDKLDQFTQDIVNKCYPEYTGKKFRIETTPNDFKYNLRNYWDGGTKHYIVAMNLETGFVAVPKMDTENPAKQVSHSQIQLPANHVFVEHLISCGKDMGLTIYVREDNATRFLPKPPDENLSLLEKLVIWYTCRLKNTYAGKSEIRFHEAKRYHKEISFTFIDWMDARESLVKRGYLLKGSYGITPSGRNIEQTLDKKEMGGKYEYL